METPLANIEKLTRTYSDARAELADRVQSLNEEIEKLKRRRLHGLRNAVRAVATAHDELHAEISANPDLFQKPRTKTFDGVKVGYMKGKGKLVWEDADNVVKLIRRHFPDQEELLTKTEVKPLSKAIEQLNAKELKSIGVRLEGAGDRVVIKAADSEVDKLVNTLIGDAIKEADDGAA